MCRLLDNNIFTTFNWKCLEFKNETSNFGSRRFPGLSMFVAIRRLGQNIRIMGLIIHITIVRLQIFFYT